MAETKRTTIYFDPNVYRALKIKVALTDESLSEVVNNAVRESLREDELDLADYRQRRHEPSRPFQEVVRDLKRKGLL